MTIKIRGILCAATLFAIFSVGAAQQASVPSTGAPHSAPRAAANYAKLPTTFEGNVGQTAAPVKFLSRGSGYVVFLTASGMVFSAHSQFVANPGTPANTQPAQNQTQGGAVIQLNLVGANPSPAAMLSSTDIVSG